MDFFEKERILSSRRYFYRLFAALLYYAPTEALVREIADDETIDRILTDGDTGAEAAVFFRALKGTHRYQVADWEALRQEYVRLFADAAHVVVCPWESVYRSREHIIFDEHTLAVQDFYLQWGVAAKARSEGPADHIGLECSFLSYLCEEATAAIAAGEFVLAEKNLAAQRAFLTEHLCVFVDEFCAALQAATDAPFYCHLANFLRFYAAVDLAIVNDLLENEGYEEE